MNNLYLYTYSWRWCLILELWWEAIKGQGPITLVLGLLAYYFLRRSDKAYRLLIEELKKEVDRIAESRNRLERIVLKNRLSSDDIESELSNDDQPK